jgi:hypothetical protein
LGQSSRHTGVVACHGVQHESQLVIARLAATQRGLFSAPQARQAGISVKALQRAIVAGSIRRVRRGVYAMAGVPPSPFEQTMAAVLALGPKSAVSHASAAAIHGLPIVLPAKPELTLAGGGSGRIEGVAVHHVPELGPKDVVVRHGIQLTTAARSVVDLASRLEPSLLAATVRSGLVQTRFTIRDLEDALARRGPGFHGRRRIEGLIDLQQGRADSFLELRVYPALASLGPFETQYCTVAGGRALVLDTAWPQFKVTGEAVGFAPRAASRAVFDAERRKFNVLTAEGWRIAHLTASMTDSEMVQAVAALLPASWVAGDRSF